MIEMCMRQKHVINGGEFINTQIPNAGPGVDEHIGIQQHGRGTQVATDTTAATEYPELHRWHCFSLLVRERKCAVPRLAGRVIAQIRNSIREHVTV